MPCTYSLNDKTKKCRSKREHARFEAPTKGRKRGCRYSRAPPPRSGGKGKCRSKKQFERDVKRAAARASRVRAERLLQKRVAYLKAKREQMAQNPMGADEDLSSYVGFAG
jgi:hypothetical protein